jgi:hypothetical protein
MARRLKRIKAQKDRLLDACRDLVASLETADAMTPKQQDAFDKAQRAIDLNDYADH